MRFLGSAAETAVRYAPANGLGRALLDISNFSNQVLKINPRGCCLTHATRAVGQSRKKFSL